MFKMQVKYEKISEKIYGITLMQVERYFNLQGDHFLCEQLGKYHTY